LIPYPSRILADKYSGTPINPAFNLVTSYPACFLGKFYAWGIENRRFLSLYNVYGYLWKERVPPKGWARVEKALHATEALHFFHITCDTSMPGSTF
jgi:hypothetical protein